MEKASHTAVAGSRDGLPVASDTSITTAVLGGGGGGVRRAGGRKSKAARSRDGTLVHRGPSFKASSVVQSDESTLFYITLNIEDVEGDEGGDTGGGVVNGGVAHVDEGSCEFKVVGSGKVVRSHAGM